jgi:murein tripeptide amidase MpaA
MFSPSNSDKLMNLLTLSDIHVVPIVNPDGVVSGNSRVSFAGVDLNRRWKINNSLEYYLIPEITSIRSYMAQFQTGKILMHLDFHGNDKSTRVILQGCE